MFKQGDQIGTYSLIEKLGRGAFGEVWLAEEKTAISAHRFAIKLPNEADVDLDAIRQEADVWESVKGHPNILPIIKADIFDGQIYIASEYAPDGSLNEWLKKHNGKAPSVEVAVHMTKGILCGLEHLHSKGVIHRDLKPANILLQSDTPRIADFGIARLAKSASTTNSTMSAGTPSYMAPECFYSVRSEQTDIWAVGVLLHKLLSGKLPFMHPDQVSVMNAILNEMPTIAPELPTQLQNIISKALQKDAASRYQSAAQMREDLNKFNPAAESEVKEEISANPVITSVAEVSDKEEETIVRPAPAPIYVEEVRPSSPNIYKSLTVGFAVFLVLAAITAWAALNFGSDNEMENQNTFSGTSNISNSNSNLNNRRTGTSNPSGLTTVPNDKTGSFSSSTAATAETRATTDEADTEETKTEESAATPAVTPYEIKSDEPTLNVNSRVRPRQTETPATNEATKAPTPAKSPAPTPVEIAPPPKTTPRNKATPKPTEEDPPAPKGITSGESNTSSGN